MELNLLLFFVDWSYLIRTFADRYTLIKVDGQDRELITEKLAILAFHGKYRLPLCYKKDKLIKNKLIKESRILYIIHHILRHISYLYITNR